MNNRMLNSPDWRNEEHVAAAVLVDIPVVAFALRIEFRSEHEGVVIALEIAVAA